ncbi:hypothetical protein Ais01nite_73790 [Asanoa ishikariensis]|uniref:hypothetical protein n=1 Tax=Asanoa ishikariensis TaxID=137265 RepID=UPI000B81F272|nr:hypothetical protein [Asanoa ishikariensis]GIF69344.1 hypothetical protein Ais01nite_73790 [Asanoa ishikariensis]
MTNRKSTARLKAGHRHAVVLEQHARHAHLDVCPPELGKVRDRSHGSIRRILERLAPAGPVTRTQQQSARFRITT